MINWFINRIKLNKTSTCYMDKILTFIYSHLIRFIFSSVLFSCFFFFFFSRFRLLFKSDWFLLGINVLTSSNFVKDLFILLSFTIYIRLLYLSFFSLTLATTGVAHWPFGYYVLKFHDFFSNFIPGGGVEKKCRVFQIFRCGPFVADR